MINKKYLKLLRFKSQVQSNKFVYNLISKRIIDSLDIIKHPFENIIEIGINDDKIHEYLISRYKNCNIQRADIVHVNKSSNLKNNLEYIKINLDNLNLVKNSYDLVYSNFFLHLFPDFNKILSQVCDSLKPNSFFIAAIPDVNNIYQLVNAMYRVDMYLYNGAYRRINPTINIEDLIIKFKKFNFENPIINSDTITIEYEKFINLLKDMKSTNLTYCHNDKKKLFEKKEYFKLLEEDFVKSYSNKNFVLDIKFNIISVWKK